MGYVILLWHDLSLPYNYLPFPINRSLLVSGLRLDALNMCEKCDAAGSRDLGNDSGYTETSSA